MPYSQSRFHRNQWNDCQSSREYAAAFYLPDPKPRVGADPEYRRSSGIQNDNEGQCLHQNDPCRHQRSAFAPHLIPVSYTHLDVYKRQDMSDEEKIGLLAQDGMLVKRPLVVTEDRILVGFKEKEWEEALLKN